MANYNISFNSIQINALEKNISDVFSNPGFRDYDGQYLYLIYIINNIGEIFIFQMHQPHYNGMFVLKNKWRKKISNISSRNQSNIKNSKF